MSAIRIALFLLDRTNDYQSLMQADAEHVARRLGVQVTVSYAELSTEAQIRQIRAALAQHETVRPQAILVCPVSEMALMTLVHDAARLGVAWVMLSRWNDAIVEFRRQYAKVPIFAVLPDHVEIGRIQGKQLRLMLAPGDELVYIQGPISTFSTRRRLLGIEGELSDKHDFRWSHFNADWSEAGGRAAMASWLSTFTTGVVPEFVLAAQNDSMAMGARQAVLDLRHSGKRVVLRPLRVLGCDGAPRYGQRLVNEGQLQATVVIPPIAGRAIEEVVTAFRTLRQPAAEIAISVRSHPDLSTLVRGGHPG